MVLVVYFPYQHQRVTGVAATKNKLPFFLRVLRVLRGSTYL
jgi:hypothetical protein